MAQEHTGEPIRLEFHVSPEDLARLGPEALGDRLGQQMADAIEHHDPGGSLPVTLGVQFHPARPLPELADRVVRMAGGMREHIAAGRLLDAWAAADWLVDMAQEVKASLPVSAQDIVDAVEGRPPAYREAAQWMAKQMAQAEAPAPQEGQ